MNVSSANKISKFYSFTFSLKNFVDFFDESIGIEDSGIALTALDTL